MSFSGRVDRESHEGGLLISFEGRPPRLGARMRVRGGKILGKVETVLGPIESPLIHVHPLYDGIDSRASVGSPVEIAPRENSRKSRPRGNYGRGNRNNKSPRGKSVGRGRHDSRDSKRGGNSGRGNNHYRRGVRANRGLPVNLDGGHTVPAEGEDPVGKAGAGGVSLAPEHSSSRVFCESHDEECRDDMAGCHRSQ